MPKPHESEELNARLALVLLSLGWGVTWPIMKIALTEIPPFSMRVGSAGIGALTLLLLASLRRRRVGIPRGTAWAHAIIGGVLNIVGFSLFSAFAQLSATTGRVAILCYTMPIWACLLARPILGERFNIARLAALLLCAVGLAVLIYPLAGAGVPLGLVLAIGAGASWAAGTVYMKWAQVESDPIVVSIWQLIVGFLAMAACLPVFEGSLQLWPVSWPALFGVVFTGVVGSGFSYFLWFTAVQRLPAMTASLGVLSAPVIGVVASVFILGERPTMADIIGFTLILSASACVLLQPQAAERAPEPT